MDWSLIDKYGVAAAVMIFLLGSFSAIVVWLGRALKRAAGVLWRDFVIPMRDRHIQFLDSTEKNLGRQTEILDQHSGKLDVISNTVRDNKCKYHGDCANYMPKKPG